MQRRDISMGLFASAAGAAMLAERAEAQTCTAPCYAQTALEGAAGITPSNLAYLPGDVRRYGADPTGAVDSTAAFRSACFSTYAGWTPATKKANVCRPGRREPQRTHGSHRGIRDGERRARRRDEYPEQQCRLAGALVA